MEPIIHKAKGFKEADAWDILQHIQMTPEERQKVGQELKERFFGKNTLDVRKIYEQ